MAGKTFQDFLDFRNKTLAKSGGQGIQGYHVFDNKVAKEIFDAKPRDLRSLAKIKGFPEGGARSTKYGKQIVNWFSSSSLF